MEAPKVSFFED